VAPPSGKTGPAEIVALIGPRCSGKTSVGVELARRLGWPFLDLDEEIARAYAQASNLAEPVAAGLVLATIGEPAFRALEERALAGALEQRGPLVLATSGGVVESASSRASLSRRATCVWLRVTIDEMQRRLRADPSPRPSLTGLDPAEELAQVVERREPLYSEISEIELDCRGLRVAEIAKRLALRLGRGKRGGCGGSA